MDSSVKKYQNKAKEGQRCVKDVYPDREHTTSSYTSHHYQGLNGSQEIDNNNMNQHIDTESNFDSFLDKSSNKIRKKTSSYIVEHDKYSDQKNICSHQYLQDDETLKNQLSNELNQQALDQEISNFQQQSNTRLVRNTNESLQNSNSNLNSQLVKNLDSGEINFADDSFISGGGQNSFTSLPYTSFALKKKKNQTKKKDWNNYWQEVSRFNDNLWDICCSGDLKKLVKLFQTQRPFPVSINAKSLDSWTAIHLAVNEGYYDVVEYLITNHRDINLNAKTSFNRTPIHYAVIKGYLKITEILIKNGAEINCQDNDQFTPLHYASQQGFEKIVQLLLEQENININIKNYQNNKPQDISADIRIYNMFRNYQDENSFIESIDDSFQHNNNNIGICRYQRCVYDNRYLIKNSRSDQIQKILQLVQQNKAIKNTLEQSNLSSSNDQYQQIQSEDCLDNGQVSPSKQQKKNRKMNKFENILKFTELDIYSKIGSVGPKDFVYLDKLGKGAFGNVYLVQKKNENKLYAMKALRKDKIFAKNQIKYVKTEQQILTAMNHPFIVKLNYAFQTDNKLYLVMDYCSGGDLEGVLIERGRLSEELAKIYISEIILALEALHNENIVFRDLKPQNVVIDEEGHACLIDFGLSRQDVQKQQLLTTFCGTLAYLAPEMLDRKGHNFSIDFYLLGVLTYELLTGYPPFYSDSKKKLFENIRQAELYFPRYISTNAKDFIQQLMNRDPKVRLGSINGANEVKSHLFLSDINWQHVYQKKLKPPKPESYCQFNEKQNYQNEFIVTFSENDQIITEDTKNFIPKWDFSGNH